MSKQIEALKLALEALKTIDEAMPFPVAKLAQKAIKEALAQPEHGWTPERIAGMARLKEAQDKRLEQPEQEPVAFASHGIVNWIADKQFQHEADLYTAPQHTWVSLTDEEIEARAINFYNPEMYKRAVLWAQEKLKERNQ